MSELIMIDEPESDLPPEAVTGIGKLISDIVDSCVDELVVSLQNTWTHIRENIENILNNIESIMHKEKEEVKRHRLHALFMAALLFVIAKPIALMFVVCCVIVRSIQLHKHQDRGSKPLSDDNFNNVSLLTIA